MAFCTIWEPHSFANGGIFCKRREGEVLQAQKTCTSFENKPDLGAQPLLLWLLPSPFCPESCSCSLAGRVTSATSCMGTHNRARFLIPYGHSSQSHPNPCRYLQSSVWIVFGHVPLLGCAALHPALLSSCGLHGLSYLIGRGGCGCGCDNCTQIISLQGKSINY